MVATLKAGGFKIMNTKTNHELEMEIMELRKQLENNKKTAQENLIKETARKMFEENSKENYSKREFEQELKTFAYELLQIIK